jgi:hypothetical protein
MLRTVIAAAFRSKGKKSMSKSELNYVLSFDLKWFSHERSKQIVELALKKGLLTEANGLLRPSFNIEGVEIPLGFKPELKRVLSFSTFDEIVWEIAEKSGKDVAEVTAMINRKQEELGNILDVDVVALLVARSYGVDVSSYIEEVWKEVIDNQ